MAEDRGRDLAVPRSAPIRQWEPTVFGIVPEGARRRRPSDIVRVGLATLAVVFTALGADEFTRLEMRWLDLVADLPSWIRSGAELAYEIGSIGTVVVLLLALLVTRRWRLLATLGAAGILAYLLAVGLRALVDVDATRTASGIAADGSVPQYPVVALALSTAIMLVAGPYLLRPARHLVVALLALSAGGAVIGAVGLPDDVVAGFALGWGVAACVHLLAGTPAATPSTDQIAEALDALGVTVANLELAHDQVWGTTRYVATAPGGGALAIEVIGRDATDARLFSKLWRFAWYRDSGPRLALTRHQQLEHQAYVLLLARQAGVPVSDVVIAGTGGRDDVALLVLREPEGARLSEVTSECLSDAVLDDAWTALTVLHDARLSHGGIEARTLVLQPAGTLALVDFAHASSVAPPERCRLDDVALLATTAAAVGSERALDAAHRARGDAGLVEVLPLLEPGALSPSLRKSPSGDKKLLAELRTAGAERVGVDSVQLVALRRVSIGDLLIAAGTILGVYLLIGELAEVDYATVFDEAQWGWLAIAFLLSPLPQLTGAVALKGAVAAPLPTGPVVAEQFANNFTGLIGGTVATTALVIRFFQKQGQKVAVAASSGIVNSLAGFTVQAVLVIIGVTFTSGDFDLSRSGGPDLARIAIAVIIVGGVVLGVVISVPRLRRWIRLAVEPQWRAGRDNLRGILSTPRKAAMLFGGNLASQLLFALAIDATLHAFGQSLPLLQIIVINSFASFVGGAAPVPGGMGVIEAGLIAGFTAAGVPEAEAVAATFAYRTFTAYLPPIWGWFSLTWLRRHDYV